MSPVRKRPAAAVLAIAALACAEGSGSAPPAEGNGQISDLSARYWESYLGWHPLEATYLGRAEFAGAVPDITPAGRERRRDTAATLFAELAALDAEALDPADRLTYLALEHEFRAELTVERCEPEVWLVDHREGIQLDFLNIVSAQPLATPEDGDRMIERWNAIAEYLDDYVSNLRSGMERGRVAARVSISRTIVQLDALLERPAEEWPLYAPAGVDLGDWPEDGRRRFRSGIRDAVTERIRPAYERLRDFLRDELYERGRDGHDVGLASLPGGSECYLAMIHDLTTLDLTPDIIHEMGREELARIHDELRAVGEAVLGTSDLKEIQRRLRSDPAMHFLWPAELTLTARAATDRAQAVTDRWFGRLPDAELVIRPIPGYEAPQANVAYYRPPAPDGSRPGVYFINTYRPDTRPRYQAEVLTFHETFPGHHLQTALAQEVAGLPEFRKHNGATAFVEGWALYAERLADEMGVYSGDLDRLGMISYDAWRASRLIVDTGLHAFGWSRDQAVAFLRDNTLLAEANIENEVDRYITSPAQALSYKLGQLKIVELREEARTRMGSVFRIQDFHDRLLENGALPLPALEEAIERWISEASPPAAGG